MDGIGDIFVVSYYRMIYRDPKNLIKFYDSDAVIARSSAAQWSTFSLQDCTQLNPVDDPLAIIKIHTHYTVPVFEGISVSVYGSVSQGTIETTFSQQFILRYRQSRWFIISDTFYLFNTPRGELVGAESEIEVQRPVQFYPPSFPKRETRKKTKYSRPTDHFDPKRSITIMYLSNNYSGDELKGIYAQFGNITNAYYTFNTVYIEYEDPNSAEKAYNSRNVQYQGQCPRVERGINLKITPRNR